MEERHERVVSASLRALALMTDTLARQHAHLATAAAAAGAAVGANVEAAPQPQQQQQQQQAAAAGLVLASALPSKPGFFKTAFGSASPAVRAGAYG